MQGYGNGRKLVSEVLGMDGAGLMPEMTEEAALNAGKQR